MSEPTHTRPRGGEPQDRQIRRSWWVLVGALLGLCLVLLVRAVAGGPAPADLAVLALVVTLAVAAVRHREAVRALEAGRRAEAESFARILQGLSRSISADAIVEAIVQELAIGTGADHVVVVRRADDGRALVATLVSRRPGVPNSTTLLPASDLDAPIEVATRPAVASPAVVPLAMAVAVPVGPSSLASGAIDGPTTETGAARIQPSATAVEGDPRRDDVARDPERPSHRAARPPALADRARSVLRHVLTRLEGLDGIADLGGDGSDAPTSPVERAVADRIAARVRDVYGLKHTLAAPLRTDEGIVGAIVVSRRVAEPWPTSARRLVAGAAVEASAALSRARSHRAAETLASTDALTGLPNRRYFDEFCGLLARRRRAEDAVGLLMIDIDRFKRLNDTYGHAVGDEVLRMVGRAIASAVREDDVPARYGGEEFAVLLRNPGPGVAAEVGERVRLAVRELDVRRYGVPSVSVSVGVAVARAPDEPIADLVARADRALYEAKRTGRDRVVAA